LLALFTGVTLSDVMILPGNFIHTVFLACQFPGYFGGFINVAMKFKTMLIEIRDSDQIIRIVAMDQNNEL
jgi:hypothetical protein